MAVRIDNTSKFLSSAELKELALSVKDVFFFSMFIWVVHPKRGKVRFELYPYQNSVLYQFLAKRFNIILKFRQAGITELIAMYCLWLAMYHPNKKINIISIKDTVAKKVLKKIKFMYKNLPDHLKTPIVNGRGGEVGTTTEIEFINGSFITSIPTTEDAGRSEGLSLLVIDEAAIIRWASTIWAAAFPTLSTGGSAIVNSCITGDTEIVGSNGSFRVDTICPKKFGKQDISSLGLKVLTHTGKWQRVIGSVNKGLLETWEIKNKFGDTLKCTPHHKLLTSRGWKTVKDIINTKSQAIFFDTGIGNLKQPPITVPPEKEIIKVISKFPNYSVSNLGKIYINKGGKLIEKEGSINNRGYHTIRLWKEGNKKTKMVHNIVAEAFIGKIPKGYVVDHIDNVRLHNYTTNLDIVTIKENAQRAIAYSRGLTLGNNIGKGFPNLQLVALIKENAYRVKKYGDGAIIFDLCKEVLGKEVNKSYVTRILKGNRCQSVQVSELTIVRKYMDNIYDICVENDESYVTNSTYVSHNTPYGVGNFYHSSWVDAVSGDSPLSPIRLRWQMHPERDQDWYDEMSRALGTKRTAQEIDGDFLSSGNSVFDLADIKAIEQCLSDYPVLRTRFNGQYKEFDAPDKHKEYFIGGDCSTGRSSDYSSFTTMDKAGEEANTFKGRMPLNKFSRLLADTGQRYNYAKLAPETNDVGMAVTSYLQDEGYPNMYYFSKILKKKGKKKPEVEQFPGWLTTTKNRSLIIEGLEQDIREDNIIVKDPFFVQEAYTFIYDGVGRPVAMGKHQRTSSVDIDLEGETYADDCIFGKAITNHIRKMNSNNVVVLPQ